MSDNKLVFRGNITKILEVKTGEGANGAWKAISFLVKEVKDEYPQSAVFKLFGTEKVDNFIQYNKVGKLVDVSFNLKANPGSSEGQFFNNLDAWKVFGVPAEGSKSDDSPADDDLPF